MNTYTCTEFTGHYPVGTAAIVRASDPVEAAQLLNAELIAMGLSETARPESMQLLGLKETVRILCDGNY